MELIGYDEVWEVYTNLKKKPIHIAQSEDDAKMWAYTNIKEEFYIQKKFELHKPKYITCS